MPTQLDVRQSVYRSALNMAGTAANASLDGIIAAWDPEIGKLFEDRNILLTDGGSITFTGTQVQFTENLNLTLNQKISGAVPMVISLGSATQTFTNSGDMWVAVINRTAGTATSSIIAAGSALPAVSNANQEVFLIAKRVDAADGTQRLYWRNGFAQNAGQTLRLGQGGGSGSGVGGGSDLNSLTFRAQFIETFTESGTSAVSAVNIASGFTNAVYSAAKQMFTINYDAAHTASSTGTAVTVLTSVPGYTVAIGDVVVNLATNEVKKITAVTDQQHYTIESAFASNMAAQAVCISQAVHTKDIYNYNANSTAASLAQAFPGSTFSEILVDYEDNATSGSNLWTPDVAPFAAFVASTDNTNWTTLQTRTTLETDQMQSDICPTAGSSLYLRFFSDKTSGAGFVNLISYEAFMQKSLAQTQGGSVWSAYAMSNGVGTEINCTIGVVGGKTTIVFINGNQYAVGVNPGQAFGVLDVYLNGQMLPRFVSGSVPTTDGYYTELTGSSIQLDRDYSSVSLDIQVVLRTQIVDASTSNNTNISYLQQAINNGFQPFVNPNSNTLTPTTSVGAPTAGTFYSSITNRAPVTDFTQDLKARFGVERSASNFQQLQTEAGPNGEPVFSALNDTFGQMRFVGSGWTSLTNDSTGPRATSTVTTNLTDYMEIVFYGTGLNLLTLANATLSDYRASIDGAANGSNLWLGVQNSNVLQLRNVSENIVLQVASGLTLGVHTARIYNNNATQLLLHCYGFEIINQISAGSNLISINPGVSYNSGSKLVLAAQNTFAYNSVATGTRGGKVLVYQNSDGSIGKSFQAVNGSTQTLTSADHTNEEMSRVHYFREFGAYFSSNDFSSATTTPSVRAFTLDDGTTTLTCSAAQVNTTLSPESILIGTNATFMDFTFIGTGLDIVQMDSASGGADSYNIQIDGGSTIALPSAGSTIQRTVKLVSGLPYGTHTVRINRVTAATWALGVVRFIVYHPKKPSLPSGATEIATYNVLANYVANATAGVDTIATGVIRKFDTREFFNSGTWTTAFSSSEMGFWQVNSSTTGDFVQYAFFGTGFEFRNSSNGVTSTWQVNIDGSTALNASNSSPTNGVGWTGALTTSFYGTNLTSFTASTGNIVTSATNAFAGGITVSGLTLGFHTVRITKTAGTGILSATTFDLIVPIHSTRSNIYADIQNTLMVGSNSLSDGRKITPVKDPVPDTKAWAQATAVVSNPTTGSTVLVPCPDMSVTIKTSGGPLQLSYKLVCSNGTVNDQVFAQMYLDGVAVGTATAGDSNPVNDPLTLTDQLIVPVSAGTHKVDVYWGVGAGLATADGFDRTLIAKEI